MSSSDPFRSLCLHLHRRFSLPMTVRRYGSLDCHGDTCKRGDWFYIRVRRDDLAVELDTLVHEVAHVLCWDTDDDHSEHGPEWGVAYAKVYRAYLDWHQRFYADCA